MFHGGGGFPFGGGNFDDDGRGHGFGGRAAATGAFTRKFRAYPVSFIDRGDLENGDKIVLPPSALDSLARLNITYPMLFQLESRSGLKTHTGVLEFIAEEGHANLPYWLMQNLGVTEGGMITIRNANLEKGTYVKLQPQSSDFLAIANPKAVLEATLRNFTCLTKGDAIAINYNDRVYRINVLEVAPGEAISIIEADVNVDFAPPADYVEPEPPKPVSGPGVTTASTGGSSSSAVPSSSMGSKGDPSERLKQRLERLKAPGNRRIGKDDDDSDDSDDEDKPAQPPPPRFPGAGQTLKAGRAGSSGLTFGGSRTAANAPVGDEPGNDSTKNEDGDSKEKTFQAFSGEGRTLR